MLVWDCSAPAYVLCDKLLNGTSAVLAQDCQWEGLRDCQGK